MPKKRGFVRYTKKGKLIPGSLVVTTSGGYPDKSSLWKEVSADLCCDSGGNCEPQFSNLILTETTAIVEGFYTNINITLLSEECETNQFFSIVIALNSLNYTQLIDILNTNFSFLGFFSYTAPDVISLQVSSAGQIGYFANTCPNSESWSFEIAITIA